ncbi:hypothetical protein FRC04_001030 [Tulasnella sp. 424]|nr:hypothetical protein FRC04_001030 [Tulasnella sp. 424]KAG8977939.1 hypothetical protein FRC05_000467 [Tulasnella sp. 425]
MIGPAIIPGVLLLAGSAFASQVHGARDGTAEAITAVTESGSTVFTTVPSIIKPTPVRNATDGRNGNNDVWDGDLKSIATPINTSAACYCSIPVTTATAEIQTSTVHGPTPTTVIVTVLPASPDAAATTTICLCQPAPTSYVDVTTPQSIVAPTTQSVAAVVSEGTAVGGDNVLLRNWNGAATRVVSVRLAAVATFFGIIGVGVVFL